MTVELIQAMVKIPVMLEHSVSWLRPTVMFLLCCLYHCCRNRLQVLGHEISYSKVARFWSEEGFFFPLPKSHDDVVNNIHDVL